MLGQQESCRDVNVVLFQLFEFLKHHSGKIVDSRLFGLFQGSWKVPNQRVEKYFHFPI